MVTLLIDRLELIAKQHADATLNEMIRHNETEEAEERRRNEVLLFELGNLLVNTKQRFRTRGVDVEAYVWLHLLRFEQTFIDMFDAETKDWRVHAYFDPMLAACDGDKYLLMRLYKFQLDRNFPITRPGIAWNPQLIKVPYTPRRKSDTRTETFTVIHRWSHPKKAA